MPGFLSLPSELRDIILDYVARGDKMVLQCTTHPPRLLPSSGMFLASKQLHIEYQEILDKVDRSNINAYHIRYEVFLHETNHAISRDLPAIIKFAEDLYIDLIYDCSGLDMTPELDPLACTSSTMAWPRSRSVRNQFLQIRRNMCERFILQGARYHEDLALKRLAVHISFRGIPSQEAGVAAMLMRLGAELSQALIHSVPQSVVSASVLGPGGVGHYVGRRYKTTTSTARIRRGVLYTGGIPEWAELLTERKATRSVSLELVARDRKRDTGEQTEMHKAISRAQIKTDVDWWVNENKQATPSRESDSVSLRQQSREILSNPFAVLEESCGGE
ncbi:hypothetical protein M409DRAFT_19421 [Zasmidium cellare ATCC 36951]|uniref:F-box domain-containing protein n=1 Tax=Zasmidium cellare ATCC 36951 TaxID=1080233 RepID=A0A6A6CTX6_ZASCE|nr:uncharacterized protein M409DRAFT_19421 [Zasmidium cellare ATCC 36951]KAF2170604.1 hypothetical protein M409DRAFT_19421 [Zasmidium cellare ATCC 36951]